jgi:hypothetical protein
MLKLYGLAEKLSSDKLMDDAMTALFPIVRFIGYPDFEDIKLSYAVTSPGSPLRDLMAGSFAWRLLFAARKKERAEEDQEVYDGLQASRDNLRRIREQICAKRDAEVAAGVFEESDDEEELEDNSEGEKTVEAGEPEGVAEEEKEESQKTEEPKSEEPNTEEPILRR